MRITSGLDLSVRVLTYLATLPDGTRVTAGELGGALDSSVAFLGKILQRLVATGLVRSHRGHSGGFELGRPAAAISVLDAMVAIEGPIRLNECLQDGARCSLKRWCAQRDVWWKAQTAVSDVLRAETIAALAERERARHPTPSEAISVLLAAERPALAEAVG